MKHETPRQGGADHNNATLVEGATPLHWAAVNGHVQMAKLLLEARAELAPRSGFSGFQGGEKGEIMVDSVDSVVFSGDHSYYCTVVSKELQETDLNNQFK